jgi:large subunit ribosomal protein L35
VRTSPVVQVDAKLKTRKVRRRPYYLTARARASSAMRRTFDHPPTRRPAAAAAAAAAAHAHDVPPPTKTHLKTKQSAAKRIKVTGSGKLMARHSGKQHLNEKMSREQKRQLGQQFVVDAGNVPQMTKCLPYHGVNGR